MAVDTKIYGMIAIIVVTIVALGCTPVIVDQVQATLKAADAAATEWNFTGADSLASASKALTVQKLYSV